MSSSYFMEKANCRINLSVRKKQDFLWCICNFKIQKQMFAGLHNPLLCWTTRYRAPFQTKDLLAPWCPHKCSIDWETTFLPQVGNLTILEVLKCSTSQSVYVGVKNDQNNQRLVTQIATTATCPSRLQLGKIHCTRCQLFSTLM